MMRANRIKGALTFFESISLRRDTNSETILGNNFNILTTKNHTKPKRTYLSLCHSNHSKNTKAIMKDLFKPIFPVATSHHRSAENVEVTNKFKQMSHRNMAKIIDGKKISSDIRSELKVKIDEWVTAGHRPPQLTAILVGEDQASQTYVRNKMLAAKDVGISSLTVHKPSSITEEELLKFIEDLNDDATVDGILVQLPLPSHINERKICNSVSCDKDVDGFNEKNVGRLCLDMNTLIPCTPLGVIELLKRENIETFGKNVVVCGRSKNVGMPIAILMHADGRNDTEAMDATVTICHRFTPLEQTALFCRMADIIISATGVPGLIKADMVKPGATVIDVGITRVETADGKTKLVGDVDFEEVSKVAGYITPVPGGVGPMTVAMLMKNTFIAAKNLAGYRAASPVSALSADSNVSH